MTTPTPDEYAAGRAAYGWAGDGSDVEHALDLARRRAARGVLSDARPAPESAQGTARAADAAVEAAGGPDTALTRRPSVHPLLVASAYAAGLIDVHEAERAFTCQPRACLDGSEPEPEREPTPVAATCPACGASLTWAGPGPHAWDEWTRRARIDDEPDDGGPERTATDLLAYLLTQYERTVNIHAQVRMDTDEDRRLHTEAVTAMRDAAAPVARFLAAASPLTPQPAEPSTAVVHASAGSWGMVVCGGTVTHIEMTDAVNKPTTCPDCLTILRGGAE